MALLENLEPKKVFKYFEEIAAIPHGSSYTKRISDYLYNFAKVRNLRAIQDEYNNVIIFCPATPGYEAAKTVIIQGHMDMVCEKEDGVDIDFKKDGLKLETSGDYVYAKGTTLGADDGIALAYALAIMDSDLIHPALEFVFTVDEEIGMLGASALDTSCLEGKIMLNLDNEDEGYLLVSCAGGATVTARLDLKYEQEKSAYRFLKISVSGLRGGHSGTEIDKGGANADLILGRALYTASKCADIRIVTLAGGNKDNAIPRSAQALIGVKDKSELVIEALEDLAENLKHEYRVTDKEIKLDCQEVESGAECLDKETTDKLIAMLVNLPCGVYAMHQQVIGLVQTSLNLGILEMDEGEARASFSVRSSIKSQKEELIDRIDCLMKMLGGTVDVSGKYPAMEYNGYTKLQQTLDEAYHDLFCERINFMHIHAGVECGIFADKIKGLDAVSLGPQINHIHTTEEKLKISSTKKTWELIIETLKRLARNY